MDLDTFENMRSKLALVKLSKPVLIGLVVMIVMVAALAGLNLTRAATATQFELSTASPSASASSEERSQAAPATVYVHVSGAVNNPGLYEIEQGSRLAAAVDAAGGFADDAVCDSINLARIVEDGEHIVVASIQEQAEADAGQAAPGNPTGGKLVNINTATVDQLQALPGIGASTAAKIVSDRAANGPFKTISDLKRVSGVGDKKFEALSSLICV